MTIYNAGDQVTEIIWEARYDTADAAVITGAAQTGGERKTFSMGPGGWHNGVVSGKDML